MMKIFFNLLLAITGRYDKYRIKRLKAENFRLRKQLLLMKEERRSFVDRPGCIVCNEPAMLCTDGKALCPEHMPKLKGKTNAI